MDILLRHGCAYIVQKNEKNYFFRPNRVGFWRNLVDSDHAMTFKLKSNTCLNLEKQWRHGWNKCGVKKTEGVAAKTFI